MSVRAYRRTDCRLCGSTDIELVLPLAPTPVADDFIPASRLGEPQEAFPLDVFLCHRCGLVQLVDVVDASSIYVEYLYVTKSSPGLVEHFAAYAGDVVGRLALPKGSSVVEIGSNDGTLLGAFKARGMRVLGIDPARAIAKAATADGLETLPVPLTLALAKELRRDRGPFDLVVANNVIANIDDLQELGESIRTLLSPGAVFVFESGYLADTVRNLVFDNIYHEHISYHSAKPISSWLTQHGLQMFDLQLVPTKGGSIRGYAQIKGGRRPVQPVVAETIAREESEGFYRAGTYRAMGQKLARLRDSLHDLLRGLQMQGRRIAGYGASHSVTTLLHHFDIARYLEFVVDDNPRKQGLHNPGHHLPVLASTALAERGVAYAVILPWRFASTIAARNASFVDGGGRFVIPVPDVRII